MPLRYVEEKLLKDKAMRKDPRLRHHLPETLPWSPGILAIMISRYPTVFIKPDVGSLGNGIVRVKKQKNHRLQVSWGLHHREVDRNSLLPVLRTLLSPRRAYLVQQGLQLAKYRNRLLDIRVFMQKPDKAWRISGKVVRVGAPGRFVTNYHQGARPETVENVLSALYPRDPDKVKHTIREINQVSAMAAKALDREFPGLRTLGIDIAVDNKGRVWIIEVNTAPTFNTFRALKDKTMYYRILRRARIIQAKYG
ncbi:YheC/YheD family protein [Paenibacillus aurantius]|uniref:YheC/YheD family protein n=1 Tax=Paenibacillus aurantius TaxID=2918900 RepID=A0AA96LHN6_9BACL|nr:YheC/YheD family protein [Paenibacillus aurantius]WNQ12230.1 YheC/YheD family protein [Paenibacillus aurantius]